jgi:tRNA1(Val) A37 N6-methylase TrmN6
MDDFTELSKELTTALDKDTKKRHGIFFTPRCYRKALLDSVPDVPDLHNILEPSFGSGEFLSDASIKYPEASITGVELNPILFEKVRQSQRKNAELFNEDFITFQTDKSFDLIIGNPPYVVVKSGTPTEFESVTTGRPNLFSWFLHKCVRLLSVKGVLAFVLPNSILGTSYYESLRRYICSHCEVLEIIQFDKTKTRYAETEQSTLGLVLRRATDAPDRFVVQHGGRLVFSPHYEYIRKALASHPTLDKLGFGVKTGTVVWNQHKADLTDDPEEGRLLIYSGNLKDGGFVPFSGNTVKNGKKQRINSKKQPLVPPVILMNRGYGNTNYALGLLLVGGPEDIGGNTEFYAENHLNVIYPKNEEAKELIARVYEYMNSPTNRQYVERYSGNGAMSSTEISSMLPITLPACS